MAEVKLIKKEHIGSGNFKYTFQCFCSPRPIKTIEIVGGNEVEATGNAQLECDEYCNKKNEPKV